MKNLNGIVEIDDAVKKYVARQELICKPLM